MTTDLDRYIPRKTTRADSDAAWRSLKVSDFDVRVQPQFTEADRDELARSMADLCGMSWDAMALDSRTRAKKQARYVLNNVTMAEARMAMQAILDDPKSKAWWRDKGKVGGAARNLVDEVCRLRSKDGKQPDYSAYLETETPSEKARREAKNARYLEYLE